MSPISTDRLPGAGSYNSSATSTDQPAPSWDSPLHSGQKLHFRFCRLKQRKYSFLFPLEEEGNKSSDLCSHERTFLHRVDGPEQPVSRIRRCPDPRDHSLRDTFWESAGFLLQTKVRKCTRATGREQESEPGCIQPEHTPAPDFS